MIQHLECRTQTWGGFVVRIVDICFLAVLHVVFETTRVSSQDTNRNGSTKTKRI